MLHTVNDPEEDIIEHALGIEDRNDKYIYIVQDDVIQKNVNQLIRKV